MKPHGHEGLSLTASEAGDAHIILSIMKGLSSIRQGRTGEPSNPRTIALVDQAIAVTKDAFESRGDEDSKIFIGDPDIASAIEVTMRNAAGILQGTTSKLPARAAASIEEYDHALAQEAQTIQDTRA